MKCALLLLLAVAAWGLTAASEAPEEKLEGVFDLTPYDFDTVVNGQKVALVEFYAPWCGHCKHLTPEYKKLATLVQADPKLKTRVVIAKVDADKHRPLGTAFDVKGFPTIKFFSRGSPRPDPEDYSGARTAEAMLEFIEGKVAADTGYGRVEELDELAAEFEAAADKKGLLAKIEAELAELEGQEAKDGELYVKYAKKGIEKGASYFKTEQARLQRMAESGNVGGSKADELLKKINVLTAFIEEKSAADE